MKDVVDIISSEHRNLFQIVKVLETMCDGVERDPDSFSRPVVLAALGYIEKFSERLHHPKEEAHVFSLLRGRSAAADPVLDILQREHHDGIHHLEDLRRQAEAAGSAAEIRTLQGKLREFLNFQSRHIRTEEREILPLVRELLSVEEQNRAFEAFQVNQDPLNHDGSDEFAELRHFIAMVAPAPYGLGTDQANIPEPAADARPMLGLRGIDAFYGSIQCLHGIDIAVPSGSIVSIVGSNGAGKTTLMKTISGVHPARRGNILFDGHDITRVPSWQRVALGIAHCPEGRQIFGQFTVEQNLRIGGYTQSRSRVDEDVHTMYQIFPILKEKSQQPGAALSGGQQQMLAIARALMSRPKLLMLDEPSMGLAPLLVEEVFFIITRLRREGLTIMLVEQNAAEALPLSDTGYVLESGRIVLHGRGGDLAENERVRSAYLGL